MLSVSLPFESDTSASREKPMLAVAITIDLKLAAELVLALNARHREQSSEAVGICSTPLSEEMSDALLRLLTASSSRDDALILDLGIRSVSAFL